MLLFFYLFCADLRDLHSFPTRRSSDLARAGSRQTTSPMLGAAARRATARCLRRVRRGRTRRRRSEEHTSELQSHSELVCRLLLEKKNKPCMLFKIQPTCELSFSCQIIY